MLNPASSQPAVATPASQAEQLAVLQRDVERLKIVVRELADTLQTLTAAEYRVQVEQRNPLVTVFGRLRRSFRMREGLAVPILWEPRT